jgi:hypothetical protein
VPRPGRARESGGPRGLGRLSDRAGRVRDDPLLAKHGYDIIGLRVTLDRFTSLLTSSGDDEPPF